MSLSTGNYILIPGFGGNKRYIQEAESLSPLCLRDQWRIYDSIVYKNPYITNTPWPRKLSNRESKKSRKVPSVALKDYNNNKFDPKKEK
jgi:hypothetical protein